MKTRKIGIFGMFAAHNYGTTTVNWRVETTGNLQTVSDECGNNVSFADD